MMKGRFKLKHPEKYKGNPTKVIFRSSWEMKKMMEFDHDPNIEWWCSEEISIPYFDKSRGHNGRYWPDFLVKYKEKAPILIEIKPYVQTQPPVNSGKKQRFIKEALTYAKNISKWQEAKRWCEARGYSFQILTERELGLRSI